MDAAQVDDPVRFLAEAEPLLLADEARHNLLLGIAGTIRDSPDHYREWNLWLVRDGGPMAILRGTSASIVICSSAYGHSLLPGQAASCPSSRSPTRRACSSGPAVTAAGRSPDTGSPTSRSAASTGRPGCITCSAADVTC